MRIALVADTFSVEKGTGIARYSREMLRGLRQQGLRVEPIAPQPPRLPFGLAVNHAVRMPYLVRTRAVDFDLIHATSPITALGFPGLDKPKVVTYLDLMSLLSHEMENTFYARLFAPLFFRVGKFADRIIAISSQTKEELIHHLGMPPQKIAVVNLGVSDVFERRPRRRQRQCIVGYVGALTRRKGLSHLVRAFGILRAEHPDLGAKLVLCGRRSPGDDGLLRLIAELGLSQAVELKGSLPDETLAEEYNSFDVFVLPSEREGFGLPILEAQRCGVPVIIREDARIPPEVSKHCLKASSQEDLAGKIFEILTEAELRQGIIQQGLEYSRRFTWERTVQETVKVYEAALT